MYMYMYMHMYIYIYTHVCMDTNYISLTRKHTCAGKLLHTHTQINIRSTNYISLTHKHSITATPIEEFICINIISLLRDVYV